MTDTTALEDLAARCLAADGVSPFNDQALVEARRGERAMLVEGAGIALIAPGPAPEVELAVDPEARGRGDGGRLAARVARDHPGFEAWAHGDLPAARAIATSMDMTEVRRLLQLRAVVPPGAATDARIRTFTPADAEAWVAVNAAAFAEHPEQGALTLADLEDRRAEDWHDDANLLVVDGDDGLDGFAWLKPVGDVGELYALGVAPHAQGTGLGGVLLQAAFARLEQLGIRIAHLYVEGDNVPALGLYRSRGFEDFRVDVRWRSTAPGHPSFTER